MGEEERGASKPQCEGSISKFQDGYAGIRGVFTSTLPESVQHGISTADRLGTVLRVCTQMRRMEAQRSQMTVPRTLWLMRFQNID